ncbi:MAG: tetratricopeptide repeat protein, partial [Chitinophagaceae bacterium]|nr:tetratricopeptide repeat protein [Chitinophagaceae bacterium]
MKMKFLIGCVLLFAISICHAQEENVDELKAKLGMEKNDSIKTEILLKISKTYLSSEPNDAIPYATEAKELAQKINFRRGSAQALKNIGIAYYQQSRYIEALENWNQSLAEYESIKDLVGIANLQSNIGAIYKNQGNDSKALEYLFNSLRNSEQTGDKFRITSALINIGSVYQHKIATNDKALEYFL